MKRNFTSLGKLAWCSGIVVLGLLALAGAFAEEAAAPEPGLDRQIKVADAPVAEVIRMIATTQGVDVIMTDSVKGTIKYMDLKDGRLEEYLDQICKAFDLRWYKDESGTLIVSGKDQGPGAGEASPEVKPLEAPAPRSKGRERGLVELTFAEAQDLAYMFGGADQPLTQRYRAWEGYNLSSALGAGAGMHQSMMNSTGLLGGTPAGLPGGEAGGPYRELSSFAAEMPQYQLPGTYVPSLTRAATTPTAARRPTAATGMPESEVPGAYGPLSYLLPAGLKGPPVAISALNALIVQGTEEAIEEFRKLVALLDVKVPQVEIEAQFVEMKVTDSQSLGIDWSWIASEVTVDAGISPGGGTFIVQYGKGNFAATLSALLQNARARIVSAPRVTTLNNYPASITFSTTTPFFLTTSVVQPGLPGGQVVTGTELQFLPVASNLFVVPRINGDNSITTFIAPTIAGQSGYVTGPGGQRLPIPTSQSLQTMLRVKDGETIVMGGFVKKDRTKTKNKIPLLCDIPIIGPLFVGVDERITDTETLIFLTPRIVPEEMGGAATTGVVVP